MDDDQTQAGGTQVDTAVVLRALGVTPARAKKTRDLNHVVHQLLIVGLYASVFLMVTGIVIDLVRQRAFPVAVLPLGEAFSRSVHLRASGYFSLGLLLLILTPVLRVVGSISVFLWERDWHFAGITFLVLAVMVTSILVGAG